MEEDNEHRNEHICDQMSEVKRDKVMRIVTFECLVRCVFCACLQRVVDRGLN